MVLANEMAFLPRNLAGVEITHRIDNACGFLGSGFFILRMGVAQEGDPEQGDQSAALNNFWVVDTLAK